MEKARTDRASNQAKDGVPAARTTKRRDRKVKAAGVAVKVPARVKAGVAVMDRDKVAVREAVAVKTVEQKTQTRRVGSCQDWTTAARWGPDP